MRDDIRELIERTQALPIAMRSRQQWLLWRFVQKKGQDKPSKLPYYTNGNLRGWPMGQPPKGADGKRHATDAQPQVDQGHELDRAHLVTLEQAIESLQRGRWDGLGFAFLPGDGLIGIDVDRAIDPESGEIAEHCQEIVDKCASYTELSPSGTGVHVIVSGETQTFKDDGVGVEVFCGRQFFTVTAKPFGVSAQVHPINDGTLAWLREMVKGKPAPAVTPAASAAMSSQRQADKDASRYCLAALDSAIQAMRQAGSGRRNKTLNMQAFGLAQLVHTGGISEMLIRYSLADAALNAGLADAEIQATLNSGISAGLADPRNLPVREPRFRVVGSGAERPRFNAEDGAERGPIEVPPEPEWLAESSPPPSGDAKASAPRAQKRGKGSADGEESDQFYARVDGLAGRFRLVEATDQAWDMQETRMWRVPNMRIRFGQAAVKAWLGRVADNRAPTVRPEDLVFEPGQSVPDQQVNMFTGLQVAPVACADTDVKPMLDLLRHLCSETSTSADDVDAVMHWVLCWQALPLQKLGTKMQSACVFHGAQGTGKNLYWDLWRDLFGVYGITVGQTELEDKFNGWVSRKLAIIGDEVVSRQEMYHNKNRLKCIVTQETKFPIRGMQQETRWESNHANVVFLSNESMPLALEERDRRYLVVYTPLEADNQLYESVRDFKASGGVAKWLHYLQTYPVGDFNAHTKPLMTEAKAALIELNWRPPERFANEWLGHYIDLPVRVCSVEQLYRVFRRWCDRQGERLVPSQSTFTGSVKRWVKERSKRDATGAYVQPALECKEINLKDPTANRKTVRCWIPRGSLPPQGKAEGEWAYESVQAFEGEMRSFCRGNAAYEDAA